MEERETLELLQSALNHLPEEFRIAVTLRDVEGLSYEAVAEVTGLALGTVKSRIARARTELRNKLRGVL
jgi:RNA polymerase sigma-70 factor (ECF subfamily)